MSLFLPKQVLFYELFEEIGLTVKEMADLFGIFANEFKDFQSFSAKAHVIENKGDNLTHQVIERLNKSFITPFDREDIYQLAHELDDIIDLIENVIHNTELYKINSKPIALEKFSPLILQASRSMQEMIKCLRQQKYSAKLIETKIKIHELEDKADGIFTTEISHLFNNGADPITIIKLKDLLEGLEQIMDKFQKVSDIIEGIIVKSS